MLYSFLLSLVKGGNMFYKQLDSGKYDTLKNTLMKRGINGDK
ncbi:hypothetical protein Li1_1476 [Lactococcus lactis subsp. lactis]|nr:hypothetical protein LK231_1357 [Lactococcus lactis subsp. lactis]KSU05425.1 hypothetical protein Li1_1476 [Lactococcus lactis subsp. lactis]